jgi:hypothetical protein
MVLRHMQRVKARLVRSNRKLEPLIELGRERAVACALKVVEQSNLHHALAFASSPVWRRGFVM